MKTAIKAGLSFPWNLLYASSFLISSRCYNKYLIFQRLNQPWEKEKERLTAVCLEDGFIIWKTSKRQRRQFQNKREGKVLRVLPSDRMVPRNQGWLNFWETNLVTGVEVVKALMLDGTYQSRNFATLGPLFQPPYVYSWFPREHFRGSRFRMVIL